MDDELGTSNRESQQALWGYQAQVLGNQELQVLRLNDSSPRIIWAMRRGL
jgi:hypothetical protein